MSENSELFHRPNPFISSQHAHVAQQIRRDKLRIAQDVSAYPSSSSPSVINPNFALQSHQLEESRNVGMPRSGYSGLSEFGRFMSLHDPNSMVPSEMMVNFIASSEFPLVKENNVFPNVSVGWKGLNSHSNSDYYLINNMEQGTDNSPVSSMVLGEECGFLLSNTDAQSSLPHVNPSSNQGGYRFSAVRQSDIFTQIPQEIRIREENQGHPVPSFANLQTGQTGLSGFKADMRQNCEQEVLGGRFKAESSGQSLSLSLSSHNPREMQLQRYVSTFANETLSPATASLYTVRRFDENHREESVGGSRDSGTGLHSGPSAGASDIQRIPASSEPFTGYASVVKSSKFLTPTHQLLDEVCGWGENCHGSSEGNARKIRDLKGAIDMDVTGVSDAALMNPQRISSTNSSTLALADMAEEPVFIGSLSTDRNEHRRKKTRLISMLDEVYRRYRHSCRQFQMVVTSFESVAGLSNATPYASAALKAMAKHFRGLNAAINEQLKHSCKVLGEDCFPQVRAAKDHQCKSSAFRLQRGECRGSGEGSRVVEPERQQQQLWRPQRGLPERAVSVLRAWLFEHFLHPYPTDTDKHLLANKTGLTRNQVSNWFINARVRLWKPLVEEIHSLESRDSCSSMDLHSVREPADSAMAADGSSNAFNRNVPQKSQQLITLEVDQYANSKQRINSPAVHLQNHMQPTKRSRADHSRGLPPATIGIHCEADCIDGGLNEVLCNVTARTRNGVVHGARVSLTLGLRHNDGNGMPATSRDNETRFRRLVSNDDHGHDSDHQ